MFIKKYLAFSQYLPSCANFISCCLTFSALLLPTLFASSVALFASLADPFGDVALTVPPLSETLSTFFTCKRFEHEVLAGVIDRVARLGEG